MRWNQFAWRLLVHRLTAMNAVVELVYGLVDMAAHSSAWSFNVERHHIMFTAVHPLP